MGEQEGAAVEDALARFIAQLTWCKFAPHYVGGSHAEAHHAGSHPHDDTVVGLWWTTSGGQMSSVMGLAPLGEMPVTRRAPHVALVLWPGAHLNDHPKPKRSETEVGLTSCRLPKHLLEADAYMTAWDRTRSDVAAARAYPKEATARPHIAFSLHGDVRSIIAPFSVPCGVDGRPVLKGPTPAR